MPREGKALPQGCPARTGARCATPVCCLGLVLWLQLRVEVPLAVLRTLGPPFPLGGKQGPQPHSWVTCNLPPSWPTWSPAEAAGLKSHTGRAELGKIKESRRGTRGRRPSRLPGGENQRRLPGGGGSGLGKVWREMSRKDGPRWVVTGLKGSFCLFLSIVSLLPQFSLFLFLFLSPSPVPSARGAEGRVGLLDLPLLST